jgi:hypothetical protein
MGATKPSAKRWEGPVIPFEIDANFDNPDRILTAIRDHWEEQTNVRFVRRANQKDFILFRHGQECSSHVGRKSGLFDGKQHINLRPNCSPVTIAHEIGHAAGLIHEHQRSDRNDFVRVEEDNIKPGREKDFARIDDSINLTDYDYRSIMHYKSDTGSKQDGLPVLIPTQAGAVLGNSLGFTAVDLQAIGELYPHVGIVRRSDSGFDAAGRVNEIAVVRGLRNSETTDLVTAVKTAEQTLRLVLWRVNRHGGIRRVSDSGTLAGTANSIAIDRGDRFVTACQTKSGRLMLISWSIVDDKFERDKDSADAAGRASLIRLLALTNNLFVTACSDSDGELVLITWELRSDGTFRRLFDSHGEAGEVSEISLLRVRSVNNNHQVATSVQDSGGRVKIIVWNVGNDGTIARLGDTVDQVGKGSLIESAMHSQTGLLVLSCKTDEDDLKVITFSVSQNGAAVRRRGDSGEQAGEIKSNALIARPTGVLSAVKSGSDNLKLIAWRIDADGQVTRLGDSGDDQAGKIGLVRLVAATGLSDAPIISCVQSETNDLRLVSWDDQSEHGELF